MKNITMLVMAVMCDGHSRTLNSIANEIENLCYDQVREFDVLSVMTMSNQGKKLSDFGWVSIEHPACIYHLEPRGTHLPECEV